MRRDAQKAQDYAERHGVPKHYSDADQLINDPDVNAVYVATPPGSHAQYTIRAARAGKPVYVEKPMALSHADSLEMIAGCSKAGVPLFVAYYRRSLPAYRKIKEIITQGTLGALVCAKVVDNSPPVTRLMGRFKVEVRQGCLVL